MLSFGGLLCVIKARLGIFAVGEQMLQPGGGSIELIQNEGDRVPPPLPEIKTSLFRICSIQHCERIRDTK